ncbi:MAG TPA: TetR/AcrR family transcriptional regulator [Sphingomonas sp.]|nr:TetR/AcrR family transcriptional regulator [Sphingomonas sp.]
MAPRSRGRLRTNDPQGMRARILDAAADLFQSRGYHDSSVQDVKRAAGVSSGAFHHHFDSKKALGLAVIAERVSDALRQAWLDPLLAAPTVAEGVRAAIAETSGGLRAQGFVRGCPVNNLAVELAFADSDFRAALQAIFVEWQRAIAGRLAAEGMPAAFRDTTPEALAGFVVAAYSGAMTMAKAEQSPAPLDDALRLLMRLLDTGEAANRGEGR